MRIPLNWLNEFVKLPKSEAFLTDRLTMAGHMLDKVDVVDDNKVIDLELRGNRADCYSIAGIAKEISALFNTRVKEIKSEIKFKRTNMLSGLSLSVKTPLVKRVMMAVVKDVKIQVSPKWLVQRLKEYGIPPINNIVDLTNYVMIETGEPMHAFDLGKISRNLSIRLAKNGERMTTFQGTTLTLTSEDLVWANRDSVLSVAGAIGGKGHSINDQTKNVLLEAASYDRTNIRRSIHRHNLFTDAGIRHEKELDPNIVEPAVYRFLSFIQENGWGKVPSTVFDYYPKIVGPWKITLDINYLYSLGGVKVPKATIKQILTSLNFKILSFRSRQTTVLVPTYRTDVTCQEDLIEEILRIYGYEKIPTQTLSLEIPVTVTPEYINQEIQIKAGLTSLGFDEVISSSFVKENYLPLNAPFYGKKFSPVKVENEPSPDVETLRASLFPNLFEFTQKILNERRIESLLFEVGKVYLKRDRNYLEKRKLGIVYCQINASEFSRLKGYLLALFEKLGIQNAEFESVDDVPLYLSDSYQIKLANKIVGYGGKSEGVFYTELDLDLLLGRGSPQKALLWPKYPPQIEDVTLTLPTRTKIGEVADALHSNKLVADVQLVDIYKDAYTFRIWYQDPAKTLTDKEVETTRNKILSEVKKNFGALVKQ